jgi:hypothetical protein
LGRFVAFALALLAAAGALAADAPSPTPPRRTWALISAIGGTLSYVREKFVTGSSLDPYQRSSISIPDYALDVAVFRGLESVVIANDQEAEIVYARLDPRELENVPAYRKGEVAIGKLASALDKLPARKGWHRIVVMTPEFVRPEHEGLGSKLGGIGLYVKRLETMFPGELDLEERHEKMVTPDGQPTRGQTYIAPYLHARVWVLDAQTLEVIETSDRYDFVKIHDPMATELNIEKAIPPEKLVPIMEKFVERSVARTLREAIGVVTVSDPKLVDEKKAPPR